MPENGYLPINTDLLLLYTDKLAWKAKLFVYYFTRHRYPCVGMRGRSTGTKET